MQAALLYGPFFSHRFCPDLLWSAHYFILGFTLHSRQTDHDWFTTFADILDSTTTNDRMALVIFGSTAYCSGCLKRFLQLGAFVLAESGRCVAFFIEIGDSAHRHGDSSRRSDQQMMGNESPAHDGEEEMDILIQKMTRLGGFQAFRRRRSSVSTTLTVLTMRNWMSRAIEQQLPNIPSGKHTKSYWT